ncbi:hypothetical protein ACOMHN_051428 [Nucella lapillus]
MGPGLAYTALTPSPEDQAWPIQLSLHPQRTRPGLYSSHSIPRGPGMTYTALTPSPEDQAWPIQLSLHPQRTRPGLYSSHSIPRGPGLAYTALTPSPEVFHSQPEFVCSAYKAVS